MLHIYYNIIIYITMIEFNNLWPEEIKLHTELQRHWDGYKNVLKAMPCHAMPCIFVSKLV